MVAELNVEMLSKLQIAIVKVKGLPHEATFIMLQEQLEKLKKDGYRRFILNFKDLGYASTTGIGRLIRIYDLMEGEIFLTALNDRIMATLCILGIRDCFRIFSTDQEALDYLVGVSIRLKSDPYFDKI